MSTECEEKFPLSTILALSRGISDHTPFFLNIRNTSSDNYQPMFKFELGWMLRNGFTDMVREVWNSMDEHIDSMKH
jgi:hypothetical protein